MNLPPSLTQRPPASHETASILQKDFSRPAVRVPGRQRCSHGVSAAFALLTIALVAWGSPAPALVAGILFALLIGNPIPPAGRRLSKWLLQGSVVLLGFGMDLPTVLRAGVRGSAFAALTIGATMLLGFWIGRSLRIGGTISTLISAGTAICGGSAIAAVGSVLAASEAEMGVAMGAIFLLNAAALVLFPAIGSALHLTQHQFGIWAGIGIHDISSVVGASYVYGSDALQTATAVKLSRTLWIIPLTLAMSIGISRRQLLVTGPAANGAPAQPKGRATVPWFIALFLLASVLRSQVPMVASLSPITAHAARMGMTVALCLIGSNISPAVLRTLGWKAAAQAVFLWIFISIAALAIAMHWA